MNAANEIICREMEERKAFEATTVATKISDQELTIADLRKVFDSVCDQDNWKNEWAAYVPHELVPVVMAAVEFFHADRPVVDSIQAITGRVLMHGNGYQA